MQFAGDMRQSCLMCILFAQYCVTTNTTAHPPRRQTEHAVPFMPRFTTFTLCQLRMRLQQHFVIAYLHIVQVVSSPKWAVG